MRTTQHSTAPTFELPGLVVPDGCDDPARRRAWLIVALDDAAARSALIDSTVALCVASRAAFDGALLPWSAAHGVGPGELVASPFGLRACALGIAAGATVQHVERRPAVFWRPELWPAFDAGVADPDHGTWRDGVLLQGRYQGFALEAPHAGFDPNNSARWTPHELLHRAVGFAYRPDASRLWLAIGARLAELLPVVHWYGPDQVARLDGTAFDRVSDATRVAAPLAAAAWWHEAAAAEPPASLRARISASIDWLGRGARHLQAELDACRLALSTGAWHCLRGDPAITDAELDAATDAQAYALAHHLRLRDPLVEATLLARTRLGVERFDDLGAFADHIERCFDRLLFGAIRLDATEIATRRQARDAWDAAYREAVSGEFEDGAIGVSGAGDVTAWPLWAGVATTAPELVAWLQRCDPTGARLQRVVAAMADARRGPFWLRLQEALAATAGLEVAGGLSSDDEVVAASLVAAAIAVAGASGVDEQLE